MTYTVEELRDKFNLSHNGEDIEYSGKNADDGHYWATMPGHKGDEDGYQHKVYLGHNADTEGLLGKNKLRVASESTKYNHDTDVARGLAGLLKDIPTPTPAPVTKAPPKWSPSPGNSANEAAGDVPDNFWSHDSSKSFWDNIKGSPDAPDTAPGTAPGVSNSFNTNTNQSLNQNVTGEDNLIINNAGGNGRKRRSFNKLGANNFLQDFMGKTFSKNFNSGLFS